MKLQELKALLAELGLHPSRKLGQNFLIDSNTIQKILRCSDVEPGDLVVEIGPGTGAMTELLLRQEVELIAVEYDARLAEYLRNRYAERPKFKLIQADAGRLDFDELTAGRPWKCNANLPYSVSTVILAKIALNRNLPQSMTLLLQKEMVERIIAGPGTKSYGSLSVRLQSLFHASMSGTVGPGVFWPPPEVDSAILSLKLKDERLSPADYARFDGLVKHCFAQRRKKLKKRLCSYVSPERVDRAFSLIALSTDVRPEELTVVQFIELFRALG